MTKNNAGKQHQTAMIWCEGINSVHLFFLESFEITNKSNITLAAFLLKELTNRVIF